MSSQNLIVKDAVWQIGGRVVSALFGFFVISILSPYLGILRYGDYSTILKFFAIWSALADFGLYIIAIKKMGEVKNEKLPENHKKEKKEKLEKLFGKYVGTRFINIFIVYSFALVLGYTLPAYSSNPYLIYGLPIGMLFSASFMVSGILQLPLQLYRRMKDLSIGLLLARVSQFAILLLTVYVLFPIAVVDFQTTTPSGKSILAFVLIIFSVFASGLTQALYVWFKGRKYLKLKVDFDLNFSRKILKQNRKYGISYYLSSFHILVVLIFLSNFFPSTEGYEYVGIWALGLSLIEIFLIIPSALGNSLLHSIGGKTLTEKKISFGGLFVLVIWVAGLILMNFSLFSNNIVSLIGGTQYLGNVIGGIGTDTLLPFLGIILLLSFAKQVFNYIFISTNIHNKLLYINLFGVVVGTGIGLYIIPHYALVGGLITQGILELLFVAGAVFIAFRHKVLPNVDFKKLGIVSIFLLAGWSCKYFITIPTELNNLILLIVIGLLINGLVIGASFPFIKKTLKKLS